ncbi:MAG: hypothetical protein LBB58_01335, partial [Cellulomonadaceae bacterium]|nr:hypothetical protein [Cellulomonadaceae bacterium]
MSSVTVFVLPQDFAAQELLDTYERWVREGLVGEAAFVLPEFVDDSHSGPPLVSAEIIGPERGQLSETSSVGAIDVLRERKNLFVYLNSRRRDRVRVVVAQLLTFDSHTRDPEFARKAESVANQVVRAMPTSTVAGGHSTRVQRFNVLIPVSGLTGVSPDALFLGWDVNAIVSAEDHPDADHGNMRVHYPGNAVGHALTALATIGGVVSGIDAGPFD